MAEAAYDVKTLVVHGHRRAFVKTGKGPPLLLLHGLGCDHTTWLPVIPRLARHFTVIAPDLLGHGRSDKPRADYSVGGYANGMRDLLTLLGIDRATVVGHSLGGGVAMQFAYQFPERTERMLLVSPGGLGREVSSLIRAITLPGADLALGLLTVPPLRPVGRAALRMLARTGNPRLRDADEVAEVYTHLADPAARTAIRQVVRAVVDWRGQIITMTDRAYLTEYMPLCILWGDEDTVFPASHAATAARVAPAARIEVLPDTGHFPHKDHPEAFVRILRDFVKQTKPAAYHRARWRAALRRGAPPVLGLAPERDESEPA
ncbi:MAG: alpha/beta fold hydrolase [Propionibacteriales bacterium]|nr:alpha/beta fold hydrolase [Propionibacteriales bacterium]